MEDTQSDTNPSFNASVPDILQDSLAVPATEFPKELQTFQHDEYMPESNSINTQNSPPHPPEKSFKAKPAPNQLSPTIPSIHPKIKVKPAQTTRSTRSPSPLLFDAESVEKYRPVTNGHHDYAPCKPLHSHRGMDPGGFRAAIDRKVSFQVPLQHDTLIYTPYDLHPTQHNADLTIVSSAPHFKIHTNDESVVHDSFEPKPAKTGILRRDEQTGLHRSGSGSTLTSRCGSASKSRIARIQATPVQDIEHIMQQFESIPGNPSLMMRKGSEHEFCIERGSRPSSTQNGSRRSYVSSVSGLDNDKSIDKQYTMLGTTESCKSERTHFYGQSHSKTDESVELLPKPLTYIPLSYIKVQTARTNLDRYRIEQIALKRLRYVIEHNESEPDHLAVVDLLEQSALPDGLVQRFFGPSFTTIHSLRVLLLQSIDSARRYRQRVANRTSYIAGIPVMQQEGAILNTHELCSELVQSSTITAPLCRTHSSSNSHGLILAGEKQVTNTAAIKQHSQTLHTLRKEIRTPQEILSILEQVDKTLEKETTKGKMIQLRRRRKNAKAFEMGGYGGSLDASSHGMASIQRNHFCENQLDSLRLAGPAGLSSHSQKPVSRKKTAGVYIEDPPLAPNEDITKPQTPLIPIPPKKKCTPKVLAAENILKMYERNKQSKYAF